ncbi:MAG TPA: NAD(P)H:quinone oxidoreductase [Methanothrix sp.]|jgi:NAD(P)H dehydrogenase (quinone)|uniref:NAD(P)H:quinone oxidoreductase n=1 Tax=Methanothrix sp. TaxID=90426 RepID=UPI002BE8CC1C|nr:NAD(P)H:quinone oxidoreductase [Methanothrix sp.]MDI9417314.1 NAD(P)H:quinone oxidoreductase [Euryarchaeota archaeon]HON35233.1 NAD(P)H:quinone oxidoreductase [Methanothrix sp.]HRU75196.1 NAD(P)H:quinone oxidoreductase [Methanothrix sp.]
MIALIVHYTRHGNTHFMAEAIEEGAKEVEEADVQMRRIPEPSTPVETYMSKADQRFHESFLQIPVCSTDELRDADAIFFGAPTYAGSMCAEMQRFMESMSSLWAEGALTGKVGSAFTSSASQHGGQELALLGIHAAMLHMGMITVGLPFASTDQLRIDEVNGVTPLGAATISGQRGERRPSKIELDAARFQGRHVTSIASRLARK